jgi:hypothetical protein
MTWAAHAWNGDGTAYAFPVIIFCDNQYMLKFMCGRLVRATLLIQGLLLAQYFEEKKHDSTNQRGHGLVLAMSY